MPLNAVVDASVLVSAFLFPGSVPGRVLKLAAADAFIMHVSPILIEEARRSLCRPRLRNAYDYDEADVSVWLRDLVRIGRTFAGDLPDIGPVCRDADDDHVLATAVAVGADCIVTGDGDLLALHRFGAIRILTARDFVFGQFPAAD